MQKRSGLETKRGSSGIEGIVGFELDRKKGIYVLKIEGLGFEYERGEGRGGFI